MFLVAMGKEEEGLAEEREAQALDPFSDRTNLLHTWTLYLAHRFDEAIAHANHALTISVSYGEYYWLGQCYEKKGMPDRAIEFYLKAWSGRPKDIPLRRAAYEKGGLVEYWRVDEQINRRYDVSVDAVRQAMYYAHTAEKEKAIEQLQLAYRQHCNGLQFLKVEPVYDRLRDDPRFKELLARLGL
jgi:adenylate cyclase